MCLWQLATNISLVRRAPAVFLSLKATILEMDVALLHFDDIDKLIEKLHTHFLEDKNQSSFICNKNFKESYYCEPHISIND